jgi:hypothetical protein
MVKSHSIKQIFVDETFARITENIIGYRLLIIFQCVVDDAPTKRKDFGYLLPIPK